MKDPKKTSKKTPCLPDLFIFGLTGSDEVIIRQKLKMASNTNPPVSAAVESDPFDEIFLSEDM